MTKITIADTQTIHPLLSAPYIGDLMTQFDNTLATSPHDGPICQQMNLDTFLWMFSTEQKAIDYILKAHDEGRVETIEYTIPYYAKSSNPTVKRFFAWSDYAPQTHSYEVRITDPEHGEMVIEFPRMCYKSSQWFNQHLTNRISDQLGEFETHELNITDPVDLECTALVLQREINHRRIDRTRLYMRTELGLTPAQFEQNCRDLVAMADENKAITERIYNLNR